MTNNQINSKSQPHPFDLEERTFRFSESVIKYCRSIKEDNITRPLISQLVRSATSVGANYCEANETNSKKDFINKINIANKEVKETKYWLRLMGVSVTDHIDDARKLWTEAQEINLILASIKRKCKNIQ